MYFLSECVACFVVAATFSALLLTICVLVLTIKDGLERRMATPRAWPKADTLLGAQLAPVVAETRPLDIRGSRCGAGKARRPPFSN